jgi:hypothetical protein
VSGAAAQDDVRVAAVDAVAELDAEGGDELFEGRGGLGDGAGGTLALELGALR